MHPSLDQQLTDVLTRVRRRNRLQAQLAETRNHLTTSSVELEELRVQLDKEREDVRKLEGFSFAGVVASILGNKTERLDEEKKELAAAKLKYDERHEACASLSNEVAELERGIAALGDLDAEHGELLRLKEQHLMQHSGPVAEKLTTLAQDIANAQSDGTETAEALEAARAALSRLGSVERSLDSAASWGFFDLAGGGLLADIGKHSKLNDAKRAANSAQRSLRRLKRELTDVAMGHDVTIDVSGLMSFADFFFDGLIVDWMVQSKINKSRDNVRRAIRKVKRISTMLNERKGEAEKRSADLAHERAKLIADS